MNCNPLDIEVALHVRIFFFQCRYPVKQDRAGSFYVNGADRQGPKYKLTGDPAVGSVVLEQCIPGTNISGNVIPVRE